MVKKSDKLPFDEYGHLHLEKINNSNDQELIGESSVNLVPIKNINSSTEIDGLMIQITDSGTILYSPQTGEQYVLEKDLAKALGMKRTDSLPKMYKESSLINLKEDRLELTKDQNNYVRESFNLGPAGSRFKAIKYVQALAIVTQNSPEHNEKAAKELINLAKVGNKLRVLCTSKMQKSSVPMLDQVMSNLQDIGNDDEKYSEFMANRGKQMNEIGNTNSIYIKAVKANRTNGRMVYGADENKLIEEMAKEELKKVIPLVIDDTNSTDIIYIKAI